MLANPEWEKEQLFDLTKPSLKGLAYILRHKELWPKKFRWDFAVCERCAMGMAVKLWNYKTYYGHVAATANKFRISIPDARAMFCYESPYMPMDENGNRLPGNVTPEMVADRIDKYLDANISTSDFR